MTNVMQASERGSIATYVIVAVLFVVLVTGGIYMVRQNSDRHTPATQETTKSGSQASSDQNGGSQPPSKTPQSSQVPVSNTPTTATAPLPTTGPGDDLTHMFMLAIFAGVFVAYIQSRRTRFGFAITSTR